MNERVIVSKELENILDKDNVFGNKSAGKIPVTIWIKDCIIRSDIISVFTNSSKLKLEFITIPKLAQMLLVSQEVKKITIGNEESELIELYDCMIESLTVSAYEDMYLCRIIIKTSK